MIRYLIAFILSTAPFGANASVKVAFFEARDANGKIVTMEKGGRFIHVAISVGNKWMHAHPYWGVQLVDSLKKIGDPAVILTDESVADLNESQVQKYLRQKYDSSFSWEDHDKTYCSKLIANILQISPSPMQFTGTVWQFQNRARAQGVGVSPDDVFNELKSRGYHSWMNRCEQVF
ncbi:MAG: hypothetical protein J7501_02180 [Bdellovibrio sp.]|nr:hypothetical protein [Bdellovibrio sp.]